MFFSRNRRQEFLFSHKMRLHSLLSVTTVFFLLGICANGSPFGGFKNRETASSVNSLEPLVDETSSSFLCSRKCTALCNKAASMLDPTAISEKRDLIYRYLQARRNRRRERNKALALGITVVGWIVPYRNYRRYLPGIQSD